MTQLFDHSLNTCHPNRLGIYIQMLRVLVIALVATSQARLSCTQPVIDRMGGGSGLFNMIMACAVLGDVNSVEMCTAQKFQAVGLSDMCGQCISEFLLKTDHSRETGSCSRLCGRNDAGCQACKSMLAVQWERSCSPTPSAPKQLHV